MLYTRINNNIEITPTNIRTTSTVIKWNGKFPSFSSFLCKLFGREVTLNGQAKAFLFVCLSHVFLSRFLTSFRRPAMLIRFPLFTSIICSNVIESASVLNSYYCSVPYENHSILSCFVSITWNRARLVICFIFRVVLPQHNKNDDGVKQITRTRMQSSLDRITCLMHIFFVNQTCSSVAQTKCKNYAVSQSTTAQQHNTNIV